MIIGEALAEGAALLRKAGVESPSLDASLLLAAALGVDRAGLLTRRPDAMDGDAAERYTALLSRRASGDCAAYVLGRKEFRGLDFLVTADVLVPRPDTETLVEAALEWIDGQKARSNHEDAKKRKNNGKIRVIDVCTGSGCIAVSLKVERPFLDVSASDLSPAALEIARTNAERLLNFDHRDMEVTEGRRRTEMETLIGNASELSLDAPNSTGKASSPTPITLTPSSSVSSAANSPIQFYESDLLADVPGRFDLIVSNPPYVPSGVIPTLGVEVRHEPRMALDGGEDGLDLIRRLVKESRERLDGGGRLLVESGEEQTILVADLMRESGFVDISLHRDLAGLGRVTGGSAPEKTGGSALRV